MRLSIRLAGNPRLLGEERSICGLRLKTCKSSWRFIEGNRGPNKRPDLDLPADKRQVLDTILANVESIRARLINDYCGGVE